MNSDWPLFVFAAVVIRLGQMLLCTGATRSHSAAAASARLMIDLATVSLALWAVGAIWLPPLGDTRLITWSHAVGIDGLAVVAMGVLPLLFIATGTVFSATQDRTRLAPLLCISILLAAFVVPLMVRVNEWMIAALGKQLAAGQTGLGAAAVIGGAAALAAAAVVGGRKGKFNRDRSVNVLPGHHVPMQYFGAIIMVLGLGLFGTANVLLGVSAALLAGAAFGKIMFRKIDTSLMLPSVLAGAIAAAAIGWAAPSYAAVLVGAIVGAVAPWLVMKVETAARIDDAAGIASGVLLGGIVGAIGGPIFTAGLPAGSRLMSAVAALIALIIAGVVAVAAATLICRLFSARGALRLTESQEYEGVDLAEFDLNAYPDFQQTMIKSHHLRQL